MEKEYNLPEENKPNEISEPAIVYGYEKNTETELVFSPPLTEEELKEALTTEEVKDHLHKHIHRLFNQK